MTNSLFLVCFVVSTLSKVKKKWFLLLFSYDSETLQRKNRECKQTISSFNGEKNPNVQEINLDMVCFWFI